jgi:hypothetical protein
LNDENLRQKPSSEEPSGSNLFGAFFLGIGLLIGWGVGKERTSNAVEEWAVQTTRHCESSFQAEGFASVSDCLKGAISRIDEEKRVDEQGDHDGPRG